MVRLQQTTKSTKCMSLLCETTLHSSGAGLTISPLANSELSQDVPKRGSSSVVISILNYKTHFMLNITSE